MSKAVETPTRDEAQLNLLGEDEGRSQRGSSHETPFSHDEEEAIARTVRTAVGSVFSPAGPWRRPSLQEEVALMFSLYEELADELGVDVTQEDFKEVLRLAIANRSSVRIGSAFVHHLGRIGRGLQEAPTRRTLFASSLTSVPELE